MPKTESQLALQEAQLATPQPQPPSIAALLEGVAKGGVTSDNVAAVREIVAIYKDMEATNNRKAFTADMIRLKERLKKNPIKATKSVPNNDGTPRYTFAPLEEVHEKLEPLALEHGFTYTFSEVPSADPSRITEACTVDHVGGHSKTNNYTVRVGSIPKATDTQNDGGAHSYAKRQALLSAFGIVSEKDNDAGDNPRDIGHPITEEQAAELERRCLATKTNRRNFLDFLDVDVDKGGSFKDIMSSRFADADAELKDRESKLKAAGKQDADGNFIF